MFEITNSPLLSYLIIPLLICLSRIIDVSLGTLRIILVSKGAKFIAPILGFFEVLIWLVAIGQVMQNLTNFTNYIAYAAGFAIGNYLGIIIEQKLALGVVVVRVITATDASKLIDFLKEANFGVTVIEAEGISGHVHLIYTVIKRSNLPVVVKHIKDFNPKAFYSVEDIRYVSEGVFPQKQSRWKNRMLKFNGARKGK
jgi:uncharacterized protein YebE (UPF0316 family)